MSFRDMINSKTNEFKNNKKFEAKLKQEQIEKNIKTFNESDESVNMIKNAINKTSAKGCYSTSLCYEEMLKNALIKNDTKNIKLNCNFLCNRIKKELGLDCECCPTYQNYHGDDYHYHGTHIFFKWD